MNQDSENFEQLRRLLALKRHEQPPPGYFNNFSQQVIARLKAGERGEYHSGIERLFWDAPWLQRVWAALEAKPILAGVFGVAVCGLLITGVVSSDRLDASTAAIVPATEMGSTPMEMANFSAEDHPLLAKPVAFEPSSTSPMIPTGRPDDSLLSDIGRLRATPATLTFSGGH
jgi:hypothetical protein